MTWKKVVNSNTGTSDIFGGDDLDKISDLFSGTDVDDVSIGSDWTFLSSKLKLRNPGNTFSYTIVPAAIAADRNLNLPLITGTDTIAVLGLAQTFTEPITINKNSNPLISMYRTTNSVGNGVDLVWQLRDSANNQTTYGNIATVIADNTDTSEDANMRLQIIMAGTLREPVRISETGLLHCGGINRRVQIDETGLTAARTFTFPDATTTLAGLGLAQTFTEAQTVSKNTDRLLTLYRSSNTVGHNAELAFDGQDSATNQNTYAVIRSEINDNTNGSEDGKLEFLTQQAGSLNENFIIHDDGSVDVPRNRLQVKRDGSGDLLQLYRTDNSNANSVDLTFMLEDSANNQTNYGRIDTEIVDNTNGSEDGKLQFYTMKAGTLTKAIQISETGILKCGGSNQRIQLDESGLSAARTFLYPDVSSSGGADSSSVVHTQTHQYYEVEDEMVCGSISATNTSNAIGTLNWGLSAAGTATPSVQGGATNHPGIIRLESGTTSGNNCRMHLGETATRIFVNMNDFYRLAFIVRIPTITSVIVRVGLGQDLSAANNGTAGAFFQFSSAVDADNWQCITREASTSTTNTATSITVDANDWFLLEIVQNSSLNLEFYINNVLQFTHSTNEPTGGMALGACVETATTAARNLDVDWFKFKSFMYGQRWT